MAEIKGIDVSSWNGTINWKTVSDYGMGFAILRITEKGNKVDGTFEANYKGCIDNKIPVGVYKYSYATNVSEIRYEANVVVKTMNKRKLDYPVFLDIEDKCQENLSKDLMLKMIKAFRSIIVKAGYKFGIYCSYSWYQNKLPDDVKKYDCWVARYPINDTGDLQERLRVSTSDGVIGWQYSSKSVIPGIPTKTDRSVFYKSYSLISTNTSNTSTGDNMTKEKAINALIATAEKEVGYLEKKSNSQLDDKTANAGYNNYTKYWRDVYPQYQAEPWCAAFVSWCMMKTFGLNTAKKLLKHWPYVYCPTLGSLFTKYANPQRGDIVIFYRNGTFAHTGLVTKVEGDKFYTIEGNTSGASGIIANGGGVCQKSYYNSKLPGTKFCRPDYSIVTSILTSNTSSNTSNQPNQASNSSYSKWVGSCTKDRTVVYSKASGTTALSSYKSLNKGNLVDVIGESGYRYKVKIAGKYTGYVDKTYLIVPTTKAYPVGKVTANKLNVRKSPAVKNDNILSDYQELKKGDLIDIIEKKDGWYHILIAKTYAAYVSAQYIAEV